MPNASRPERVVVLVHNGGRGWDTVTLMAGLFARLAEARLVTTTWTSEPRVWTKLGALLPRRRLADVDVLLVCCQPGHLQWALGDGRHRPRVGRLSAYVIDSFWTDRIPQVARRGTFDQLFVTDGELVDHWQGRTGTPTSFLPFGTDALDMGRVSTSRRTDVLRVGRQPPAWNDEAALARAFQASGLAFRGRVPHHEDPKDNQGALMDAMSDARFTLSFSNTLSPAPYTHPTRQYLTGRWLDALASGAVVAGAVPDCRASDELLWPEASLEVSPTDLSAGVRVLAQAVEQWSPDVARLNHLRSLERLDWRHRFASLADTLGWRSATLSAELARLGTRVDEVRQITTP